MTLPFYNQSKVLLYIKELEEKTAVFLELHPSLDCNHGCVWCRYMGNHNRQGLSLEYMVGKLDKYPEVRGVRITGGGEPLMNRHDTLKFIEECSKRGIATGIETNGGLLDDKAIEIIAKNCRYCRISLDAAVPETHRKLHKTRDFDRVISNIRQLAEAGVKELGVSYLVVPDNVQELVRLVDLGLPVHYYHFKPLIQGIDEETKRKALEQIEYLAQELHGVKMRFDRIKADDVRSAEIPCRITDLIRMICADGKEYACCEHEYEPDFEVGIWDGSTAKCTSCRYNMYNEILQEYYCNTISREFL